VGWHPTNRYAIITEVFSTITSPVFSELVIILHPDEFTVLSNVTFFETLCRMNQVRPFTLVFLVKIKDSCCIRTELLQKFGDAIFSATAKGLFNFLDSQPIIHTGEQTPEWGIWPRGPY